MAAKNREQAITEKAFKRIEEMLFKYLRVAKNEFKADAIILLGGMIINTDYGVNDYFEVRNFEVIHPKHLWNE